ncbi:hypothetical protein ES332_A06G045600v1 [Gossypium tomentosum]|uniref:Uncharacterized protein n=1 Tax=Gossypium tomentosum TaxID=34277 RepID=A0A5D2Q2D1_GOSTO|nr:hypothetical protein ES332_A06G045600v1 [Gossypium tomentosum]
MLHSTTHTSFSPSFFPCFSSMSELLANSKEEKSPQEESQPSKANHLPSPNLNVLLPQPRFLVNSYSEYETDEYFGDEDSADKKQEELIMQLEFRVSVFG